MRKILSIIPHITIILSIMFITLWILDKYNPNMNFLDSKLSSILMLILFIMSIITSIIAVVWERKNDDSKT
jgi:NADH:ubiquinone oxidoreductase subunit 2 (subunit N)